jgi:hypothetical protein
MPACRVSTQGKRRAADFVGPGNAPRRDLAVGLVLRHGSRRRASIAAVLLIACPDRTQAAYRSARGRTPGMKVRLTPGNAYQASFAAVTASGRIVVGDLMRATLGQVVREAATYVQEILTAQPVAAGQLLSSGRA